MLDSGTNIRSGLLVIFLLLALENHICLLLMVLSISIQQISSFFEDILEEMLIDLFLNSKF